MSLSRMHFEAIAKRIREIPSTNDQAIDIAIRDFADSLADYFATQNQNFDRDRFIKACGME